MEMLLIIELHTGAATTSYAGLGETYVAYILLSIHTMHLLVAGAKFEYEKTALRDS
jgi:hypothetical protein